MKIGVFGLGEAGSLIAADLVKAGMTVIAYDPADVATPDGIVRVDQPTQAVADGDIVIAVTQGSEAAGAMNQALDAVPASALYADFSTNSPGAKKTMADLAVGQGFDFVDVALMGTVPGRGLHTPALVSGKGAAEFVDMFSGLGMPVEVVGTVPGDAAMRKLLRSIMMKGLAGTIIEAMSAAEKAGCSEWLWRNLADEIANADEVLLSRLVHGTEKHAPRRIHEMEASLAMLREYGIEPLMTRATVENLRRVMEQGIPDIPFVPD